MWDSQKQMLTLESRNTSFNRSHGFTNTIQVDYLLRKGVEILNDIKDEEGMCRYHVYTKESGYGYEFAVERISSQLVAL
jgi:hypothetical protein